MKKFTAIALALLLVAGLVPFTAVAGATATPQAVPAPAVVYVDGAPRTFEAYQIAGLTYFKLVDLATALKGSSAEFNIAVVSDGLDLLPGKAYNGTLTPLNAAAGGAKPYSANNKHVHVNGKVVPVKSYFIGQSSYYLLVELASKLSFNVSRDITAASVSEPNGPIHISTAKVVEHMPELSRGEAFESYIVEQLHAMTEEINVERFNLTKNEVLEGSDMYIHRILDRHPEIFYVGNSVMMYYLGDKVIKLAPEYTAGKETVKKQREQFDKAVETALKAIPKNLSQAETVVAINDYIASNAKYDYTLTKYTAYNIFVEGTAVCEGYSDAFNLLASRLGLESIKVDSDAMSHAWNMVKVDGKWYHVDVTWNDTAPEGIPDAVAHKWILLSDAVMKDGEHKHYNWESDAPKATDDTYKDAYWVNENKPINFNK